MLSISCLQPYPSYLICKISKLKNELHIEVDSKFREIDSADKDNIYLVIMLLKSIIIVPILWIVADAARILVVIPEPSHSHQVSIVILFYIK